MTNGLARFNSLSEASAREALYGCLADGAWASRLAAGRPFRDLRSLLAAAEAAWSDMPRDAWVDAFRAHPRIGEGGGRSPSESEREQRRVGEAPRHTLDALADENRRYEAKFGHVFLIAASGRTAEEILDELRRRMGNSAAAELEEAAAEHRKITRLRLERLVSE